MGTLSIPVLHINTILLKRIIIYLAVFLLPFANAAQKVVSITIDATINPATAEFIHRAITRAEKAKAECLLIHLNTPGGLLKSTRNIVGDIMESSVPVIVYVAPAGADAGSAGVFVTLSAHIAAMAPGTNIGAAHPVGMQATADSVMYGKITNDAAAFIRTIAHKRHRNVAWAENAVRRSYSYSETEALEDTVIDLIAKNDAELLQLIDSRKVELSQGTVTLHTKSAKIETYEMGFIEKLLNIISDPNVAYILLMLGFYGLMFELYNPGSILPGIVGVICIILAFYSLHTLPINYAGLALILFALLLFLLEIKIASHGVLAIGGVISLLLGSMMLIRTGSGEIGRISWSVIISATVVTSLFFLFVIGMGLKAQRLKPTTGPDALVGKTGITKEILNPLGMVLVNGELWQAESTSGEISNGEKIRVKDMQGFKLFVEKYET
jgi:membrane-bound serine protease (ClpP class)